MWVWVDGRVLLSLCLLMLPVYRTPLPQLPMILLLLYSLSTYLSQDLFPPLLPLPSTVIIFPLSLASSMDLFSFLSLLDQEIPTYSFLLGFDQEEFRLLPFPPPLSIADGLPLLKEKT